MLLEVLKKF